MYREITQDGGGFLAEAASDAEGIYTEQVESCAVYAAYGTHGLAVVHDTGQLDITSIVEFLQRCGSIARLVRGMNFRQCPKNTEQHHRERSKRIANLLRHKKGWERVDISNGKIVLLKNGSVIIDPSTTGNVDSVNGKEQRHQINLLNNLFIKPNSQSIPLDIQFDGDWTSHPRLLASVQEMKLRALQERARGDNDYLSELFRAQQMGVIDLSGDQS
ncbi:hypothetical protein [Alkalimonas mucilaginosa]|uniref:Uncharacterized protein n=1 Tax=Alkalimonas mucilaginosa TaxID=3057676 RepID=A0ABU7JG80_9GAMM|nr:hypothetical protein [Alkalimonas sp. MEB004]MEE2024687.1 hypothetical protein [Alkalimonas sp. MEB004]